MISNVEVQWTQQRQSMKLISQMYSFGYRQTEVVHVINETYTTHTIVFLENMP